MSIETPAVEDPLRLVLLESRQRWRDLVSMAADLAFETDADGNFTLIAPENVLGYEAASLAGSHAADLLAHGDLLGVNPFLPSVLIRKLRVWVTRANGSAACLLVTAVPMLDAAREIVGARGVGLDITEQEHRNEATATALRRGEVLDHILWEMRKEVLAPRMMRAVLSAACDALGAQGAAIIDLLDPTAEARLLHESGEIPPGAGSAVLALLENEQDSPQDRRLLDDRPLLACPACTRFGERAGVAFWRGTDGRDWDNDDRILASSITAIVRIVLEHEGIQREMARQARTDPLTGLLNRRAFLDELARRIDRLDREGLPGTLMFIDVDNFKILNDRFGHDIGDVTLTAVATVLRNLVRPADLVARLGGDEFALWLDGADELTAAERAEWLRVESPHALAEQTPEGTLLTLSVCVIRREPAGDSDAFQPVIPTEASH